ncbi:sugar porter family MFS transporter [Falsirhodobacter algicola]|uniref:Sugar porter family MFS transporter n=1 Tax=Falsirhodobacter algicola TaxID=2692330 RepID=A0A8J8MRM8_9RHOB|nr:sugar porter family MFS transporter [Falsirhodobacter algicola]QUS35179.1 sugar porter family MFS transporter [Falsirhodobacter algicola]
MQQTIEHDGTMSRRLLLVTGTAALGGFLFGYDSSIINGTVDSIRGAFGLSAAAIGFVVSCALLGAMVGAWYAGVCAERFGRVRTMIIASLLLSVSALGSGLAFGTVDLILWRFVGGVGVGFASVIAPAYIAEVSPAGNRGRLGTLQQMAIVVGIFLSLLISAVLARIAGGAAADLWGSTAWRWMFLSELIPAIGYGLLAMRLPESPRYLVERQRLDEARHVLQTVVGMSGADAIGRKIEEIRTTVASEARKSFTDLRGPRFGLRRVVWLGIILSVFQQFVGINVIFYYSTTLWQSVGFDESDSFMLSVAGSITNIVATVIAIALIDSVGRRKLLLGGSALMALSLGVMALAFSNAGTVDGAVSLPAPWGPVALVAANVFIIGFGASWGPAVWVLLGEMFPNRIRGMALGLAGAAQWLANFVVSTTFPILAAIGLDFAYSLYALFALLSFIFVLRSVQETKGRSLESMISED